MDELADFFLNSRASVVQLELVEVTHPDFTQPYRFVRNNAYGVTVDLSAEEEAVDFVYYPARITAVGAKGDLDAAIRVELGDLGELIPAEFDEIDEAGGGLIKPAVRYWVFRSDQLGAPIYGPLRLEAPTFNLNADGASFQASAPRVNINRTGERYDLNRFPMLRGWIQ